MAGSRARATRLGKRRFALRFCYTASQRLVRGVRMCSPGFPAHGPHDHAVEHAGHGGGDGFSNNIAVMTAILATVGAIFGYLGGATQNEAALYKNNAAIDKTTAANSWNYYQAKSSKQNLAELAISLP